MLTSHLQIIALWPTADELAAEIGAEPATVRKWRVRRRIPSAFYLPIVAAAKQRGIEGVTAELLLRLETAKPDADEAQEAVA